MCIYKEIFRKESAAHAYVCVCGISGSSATSHDLLDSDIGYRLIGTCSLLPKLLSLLVLMIQVLENRTKASCQEMQMLETLEDLRELRHRHARVDTEKMLQQNIAEGERLIKLQEEEDEAFIRLVAVKFWLHC